MSFVNLLANDVWSSLDINRRVQALVRTQFTAEDELKAARLARQESRTDADEAFIASVDAAIAAALSEGVAARADMALLTQVMAVEYCHHIVGSSLFDDEAKASAQATIDAASAAVKALVEQRKPVPVTDAQPAYVVIEEGQ